MSRYEPCTFFATSGNNTHLALNTIFAKPANFCSLYGFRQKHKAAFHFIEVVLNRGFEENGGYPCFNYVWISKKKIYLRQMLTSSHTWKESIINHLSDISSFILLCFSIQIAWDKCYLQSHLLGKVPLKLIFQAVVVICLFFFHHIYIYPNLQFCDLTSFVSCPGFLMSTSTRRFCWYWRFLLLCVTDVILCCNFHFASFTF